MNAIARFLLPLLALVSTPALADTDGTAATLSNLVVITPGSDTYSYTHGHVLIGSTYYYWGGSYCSGVAELSDADIDRLLTAQIEGALVNPWYKTPVSSEYRCLTIYQIY